MARKRFHSKHHRAYKQTRKHPEMFEILARAVEILREEDGIMFEMKLRYRIDADPELDHLRRDLTTNYGLCVILAFRHAETYNFFEFVYAERAAGLPGVVRLPGVSRTVPNLQYLGLENA